MSFRKAPKNRKNVNPDWNLEALKRDLTNHVGSLKSILISYATASTGWQGLYNDVARWREMDPDLQRMIDENLAALGGKTEKLKGRKRKDASDVDADWRTRYGAEYLATNGNLNKAAAVTPYTPTTILCMTKPNRTEYDKQLVDIIENCDRLLVGKAAESVFNSLDEAEKNPNISPKDKAYIALGILKTHSKGWQQKMELNVTGSVKFELDRGRVVAELLAEQQRFFKGNRPLALTDGNVVDVEEVAD